MGPDWIRTNVSLVWEVRRREGGGREEGGEGGGGGGGEGGEGGGRSGVGHRMEGKTVTGTTWTHAHYRISAVEDLHLDSSVYF